MSFTDIYQISGSAMTAQTLRLNTVASNLANANAPASSEAQAYKARSPVFAAVYHHSLLAGTHRHAIDGASVQVQDVLQTGGVNHIRRSPMLTAMSGIPTSTWWNRWRT